MPAAGEPPPGAPEAEAPVGPSPEEEAAFLAEQRTNEPSFRAPPPVAETAPEPSGPLPPLEELVQRIPAPSRELLEELFRAKFVTVKRVPASALK